MSFVRLLHEFCAIVTFVFAIVLNVPRYLTNGMPLPLTACESPAVTIIEHGIKLFNEQGSCFSCLR